MRLTREATIVLDIFRKFHIQAGQSIRYEAIYAHVGTAVHARKGTTELERLGLIATIGEDAELTPSGYEAMWSIH